MTARRAGLIALLASSLGFAATAHAAPSVACDLRGNVDFRQDWGSFPHHGPTLDSNSFDWAGYGGLDACATTGPGTDVSGSPFVNFGGPYDYGTAVPRGSGSCLASRSEGDAYVDWGAGPDGYPRYTAFHYTILGAGTPAGQPDPTASLETEPLGSDGVWQLTGTVEPSVGDVTTNYVPGSTVSGTFAFDATGSCIYFEGLSGGTLTGTLAFS